MRVAEDQAVPNRHHRDPQRLRRVDRRTVAVAEYEVWRPAPEPFAVTPKAEPERPDHSSAGHAGQEGLGAGDVTQHVPGLAGAEQPDFVQFLQPTQNGPSPDGVTLSSAVYEICDAKHGGCSDV